MTTSFANPLGKPALPKEGHGRPTRQRSCNLCDEKFMPRNPFERFCRQCKDEDELLRFAGWLPEMDDSSPPKLSA